MDDWMNGCYHFRLTFFILRLAFNVLRLAGGIYFQYSIALLIMKSYVFILISVIY